jgi:hypothetical protein
MFSSKCLLKASTHLSLGIGVGKELVLGIGVGKELVDTPMMHHPSLFCALSECYLKQMLN